MRPRSHNSPPLGWRTTMPDSLILRRAGPADARALAELFHHADRENPGSFESEEDLARALADPHHVHIVAEENSRLVAAVAMTHRAWNDSYELGRVLARPDGPYPGLGALLMQRAVDQVGRDGLGEVFIAAPRARCLFHLCAALDPPMIVAGHDAGRTAASGAREAYLIGFSIPKYARFIHVAPPETDSVLERFVRESIYKPLHLRSAAAEYPPECLAGPASEWSFDWGDLVVDYNPTASTGELAIVGARSLLALTSEFPRAVDRVLRALPQVQHVVVTVLADKTDLVCRLSRAGFTLAAYLPAWY